MCGIVGYVGKNPATELIWDALSRLEYKGYDSVGIAVQNETGIFPVKCKGRLADLKGKVNELPAATQGIGHIRWATHGIPSDSNAHPHTDCTGQIVVVHNGIIENHREVRRVLLARGHKIISETDTELIAHLIEEEYTGDLAGAVVSAVEELEGSMAIAVLHKNEPGKIVVYRKKSPMILGIGEGENFVASDIPALIPYTRKTIVMNDGECAVVTFDRITVRDKTGREIAKELAFIDIEPEAAEKSGFDHYMLKEIYEQPQSIERLLSGRIRHGKVVFEPDEFGMDKQAVKGISKIFLLACGTSYHACNCGKIMLEQLARIPAEAVLASEFRYCKPIIPPGSLCIAASQSGETADTLEAEREATELGARMMAITNTPLSTLALESDDVLCLRAGQEISVASTKAYTTQVVAMALLAVYLARERGVIDSKQEMKLCQELSGLPGKVEVVLKTKDLIRLLAKMLYKKKDVFFIGRGVDYWSAEEGQLKLKEITYIHAEAYAAGELKHGPLALIEPGVPAVAVVTDPALAVKTGSNIAEIKARGGWIIAIGSRECLDMIDLDEKDAAVEIPTTHPLLSPAVAAIPMQLLAYYTALEKGTDIDKPKNLAKSVTVE